MSPDSGQILGSPDSGQILGSPDSGQILKSPDSGQILGSSDSGQILKNTASRSVEVETDLAHVEARTRADLAATFQWAAKLNLHEAVANHFSAAVSPDGAQFLLNPRGRHFSRMRASELLMLDSRTAGEGKVQLHPDADPTAWYLHAHLHKTVPRARCILHTHMPYVTALTCLADFEFLMLDQNACRFHNRIAYDRHYAGMALDDTEGERVASLLGDDKSVLFLGNHGVLVIGETVAEAFDELYYLEKAAHLQVLALSTGRPLALVADEVAALARKQWMEYPEIATLHFAELLRILDEEGSNYAK